MAFWYATIEGINGGETLYETATYWYSPAWGSFLAILAEFFNQIGVSELGSVNLYIHSSTLEFCNNTITSPFFNTMIKLPLILAHIASGYILYQITRRFTDKNKSKLVTFLWIFCPLMVWNTAVQCQFESIVILLMLISILAALDRKFLLVGISIGLAVALKQIPLIICPILLMYLLNVNHGLTDKFYNSLKLFTGFALGVIVTYIGVIKNGEFIESFTFLFSRVEDLSQHTTNFLDWSNILYAVPFIAIGILYLMYHMYSSKEDQDRKFIECVTFSIALILMWYFAPANPQYALLIIPFVLMQISWDKLTMTKYKLFTAIFFIAVISWEGIRFILPLAEYTTLINVENLVNLSNNLSFFSNIIEGITKHIKFIPALLIVAIPIVEYIRNREVKNEN